MNLFLLKLHKWDCIDEFNFRFIYQSVQSIFRSRTTIGFLGSAYKLILEEVKIKNQISERIARN